MVSCLLSREIIAAFLNQSCQAVRTNSLFRSWPQSFPVSLGASSRQRQGRGDWTTRRPAALCSLTSGHLRRRKMTCWPGKRASVSNQDTSQPSPEVRCGREEVAWILSSFSKCRRPSARVWPWEVSIPGPGEGVELADPQGLKKACDSNSSLSLWTLGYVRTCGRTFSLASLVEKAVFFLRLVCFLSGNCNSCNSFCFLPGGLAAELWPPWGKHLGV